MGNEPDSAKPATPSTIDAARRPVTFPAEVAELAENPVHAFGHFILIKEVGRGGMGSVFRAWDRNVGRIVALKVLFGNASPDSVERFIREAQIAGRLRHPAIATVYEAGSVGERHFIAMQFIDGVPIDRKPRAIHDTIAMVRDAARALAYAHEQGVIHRDVKPGNLLADENRVYLTDFGTAREIQQAPGTSVTGTIIGTPQYMSPEQAFGDTKRVSPRSDVYSLGATLFALLAGRPPFNQFNISQLLVAINKKRPPRLREFNSAVSPELDEFVDRLLSKDPGRRPASMPELADELDRLLREKRYTGNCGLARYLVRRFTPWLAAAIVFGLAVRFAAPRLVRGIIVPAAEMPAEERYRGAVNDLASVEGAEPGARREIIQRVLRRCDELGTPRARVLAVRALHVDGRIDDVRRELESIAEFEKRDHRVPLLRALLAVDDELARPPPLPATGGPPGVGGFDKPPLAWPPIIKADLEAVRDASADTRDTAVAVALIELADGRWAGAADRLRAYVERPSLSVLARAWCRATYLAGDFAAVLKHAAVASPRERIGATIAVGPLPEPPDNDAEASALIRVHRAWAAVAAGEDPEPHVAPGGSGEYAAALLAARARWQSLSGARKVEPLGEPRTWIGRRARIEALLVRGGSAERALELCTALQQADRRWETALVLRARALLMLGRHDEAWDELSALVGAVSQAPVDALLPAASARLRAVEELRRGGVAFDGALRRARACIDEALKRHPNHPEALNLSAVADLIEAETADGSLTGAMEKLDRALGRVPGYVEAHVHRGAARVLCGSYEAALADYDEALKRAPELASARFARGVALFALGRPREAATDWCAAIESDRKLDTPDARAWIKRAEESK